MAPGRAAGTAGTDRGRSSTHRRDVSGERRETDIPIAPPSNLVQIGIGGWIGNRPGIKVARERNTTVITIADVEELGVERAIEIALECAWKDADAVFLSFDIDCVDPGFAPGTGTPEPGGLLPREALKALRMVAHEGICGLEVVEIAPE
jgi:arginase family enzyme